ncbi:uncharacterized protein LOC117342610 [Pecten maximus]|uniref:uncharacterized protein LOC117342610 n=1 Tax=Pecten maximus TaxID=6579 RepID=UPI00145843A7|nr:uncharacterized protein LOC117342610 [Pecten maximus]
MALKGEVDNSNKSPASNDNFSMDDEETYSTGSFSIDERGQMLLGPDLVNLNNAPAPCTARCNDADNSLTVRLTNDFIHVPHNRVTPKNVIGHCKLYGLMICVLLSVVLNIILVTVGIWYMTAKNTQPLDPRPETTQKKPIQDHSRYLPVPAGKVDNLVAVPCNARANLLERFTGVEREYINVSTVYPETPTQLYCYLPRSEPLSHFLRIINLAKHGVNDSLGIQSKHCVSLMYSSANGTGTNYQWNENGKSDLDNVIKVARNTRTNELELSGPSGFYMIMAQTVYQSRKDITASRVTLEVLVNKKRMMSESKTLLPSTQAYVSLSFHDVVHINDSDEVTFNMSHAEYIYKVIKLHTAHMCCIPVLGGCIK